jgi:dienelactone hydrolase
MKRPLISLLTSLLLCLPQLSANPAGTATPPAQARTVIVEDGGTGPHKSIATEDAGLPGMTLYRPRDLSPFGGEKRLPVLLWGNGACANTTQEHRNFLNEIASHGYLVLAIGLLDQIEVRTDRSRQPTHSSQLTAALDWILAEAARPGSPYEGRIDASAIGVMGMSCGGLQALEVSGDPRIRTTVVCNSGILTQPAPFKGMPSLAKEHLRKLHGPVLYIMGGSSDIAYGNAMDDFARIDHVPVVMSNLDVGHGGTYAQPHGGEFTRAALAWLDWQLKGRTANSRVFLGDTCELAKEGRWTVAAKNFPAPEAATREPSLSTEFVYEAIVDIGAPVVLGKTATGHRQYIPITGGHFQGAKLRGTVLPGGADWQNSRPDGVTEVEALYSMKCDDGTVIIVHNCGVITGDGGFYARTAPRFQVQEGPHAWLTRAQFVGSVSGGPRPGTVTIRVFRVL